MKTVKPHPFRCAHPPRLSLTAGESAWARPADGSPLVLTFWLDNLSYPGVPGDQVAAEYLEGVSPWCDAANLVLRPAASKADANVVASMAPIDGEWNVLALTELPPAQSAPGSIRLTQQFDPAEVGLTSDQRKAMFAHEFGHALGLGHLAGGNLMAPVLSDIVTPQAGDVAELVDRYGPPRPQTATPPDPKVPAPALAVEDLTLTLPGGAAVTLKFSLVVASVEYLPRTA